MHNFPSRTEVSRLRAQYPTGTRIELTAPLDDPYAKQKPGDRAVVTGVDDAGHILCCWDCGSPLNLIPSIDSFKIVPYIGDELLSQIKAVQMSGRTNMFDAKAVLEIAMEQGYDLLADFITSDRKRYSTFILTGNRDI